MLKKFGAYGQNQYSRWRTARRLPKPSKVRHLKRLRTPGERMVKRHGSARKLRRINPVAARRLQLARSRRR